MHAMPADAVSAVALWIRARISLTIAAAILSLDCGGNESSEHIRDVCTRTDADTDRHRQTGRQTDRHRQTQTDTHTHTHTWLIALASLCCTQSVMSRDASSKPPDLWYPTPIPLQAHRHHGDVSSLSSSPRFFGTIVVAPQHALKAAKPYRNSGS